MKNGLFFLFLVCTMGASAQTISGLYSGTLINDSTKKVQHYQLALSEYRDKITGYSYTTFFVNDTFYYSIKRVKAVRNGNELVIEDEKMLANNFPESPAKRVKQTNTIPLPTGMDSLKSINGRWQTNQTKIYYSLQGAMDLQRDNDSSNSALIAHLQELKLLPVSKLPASIASKQSNNASKQNTKTETFSIPHTQRAAKVLGTFDITSDSLVLSFYDNGVVDGDVISVYLNNTNIIANSKLLAVATKKTVHLNSVDGETLQLILVAENLGSIPPNTGLLIVQDGDKRHEVRFSTDLQTNATILFNKRKP